MKKWLSVFVAVLLVVTMLPTVTLSAAALSEGHYTYTVSNGEVTITDVDESIRGNVTIPSTLGGYPVTEIAGDAFSGCHYFTSITIGDNVNNITPSAFRNCKRLASIIVSADNTLYSSQDGVLFSKDKTILVRYPAAKVGAAYAVPDGVIRIGDCVFENCTKLNSVTIPDSVTHIGNNVLKGCTNLEHITVPFVGSSRTAKKTYDAVLGYLFGCEWQFGASTSGTVEQIYASGYNKHGYYYIPSTLKTVTITDTTHIPFGAFYNCSMLTSITIPDGVTSIDASAFSHCTNLTDVNIPDGVTSIGKGAFYDTGIFNTDSNWEDGVLYIDNHLVANKNLELSDYTVKPNTKTIAPYAFSNSSSLTSIVIPDSVMSIPEYAFAGCINLETVTIGNGVKHIGESAFESCDNLRSVVIPESVTEISAHAFDRCVSLTDVYYGGNEADKAAMIIAADNDSLLNATWRFTLKNGWVQAGDKWYFYENDTMVKNAWRKDSIGWVKLGPDGAMMTSQWTTDSQGWCYVGANGYAVTNCWKKDSVGWCYLDKEGSQVKNNWVLDGGKWYFLDADGYMVSNKWMKDSKGWVYLGSSGAMLTNAWCKDSKGWCYVGANGYAVTNCWKKDSVGWCYLDKEGSQVKNNWVKDGGKRYYIDGNGYMVANKTVTVKGKAYRFDASGVCLNP